MKIFVVQILVRMAVLVNGLEAISTVNVVLDMLEDIVITVSSFRFSWVKVQNFENLEL